MCLTIALVFGLPVIAIIFALFIIALISTLAMFGSASGLFTELVAVEVPSLSSSMQIASLIFSVSALAILGFIFSYVGVYFKTVVVTIYLKLKEQLK
jgi:hypothetical protein